MKNYVLLLALASIFAQTSWAQFKSEDEITFISTGGNSNQDSYNFATRNSYKWTKNTLTLNGDYSYGKSDGTVDVDNWSATLRFDHDLSAKLDIFAADYYESDRFKGFWSRNNYDLGLKYKFYDEDKFKFFIEVGYRYTEVNKVQDEPNTYEQKLRFYTELEKDLKEGISARFWLEYIPSLERSDNYIVKMEPSIRMLINKTFSLKSGILWEYENLPLDGKDQHDYKITTSLLANF